MITHVLQNTFKSVFVFVQDLERCVDEDFPAGTELTKLEQQREAHTAFAEARCRVYIGREEYFKTVDENRKNDIRQPFVLLGESGVYIIYLILYHCFSDFLHVYGNDISNLVGNYDIKDQDMKAFIS